MPINLFDFQDKALPEIGKLLAKHQNVLVVSPGGSGKTILMSAISQRRVLKRPQEKICIFVHREELFNQTREKLLLEITCSDLTVHGIISQGISADTTYINPNINVYVVMVETFFARIESESFLSFFKDVSLYFVDETHRTDFIKIYPFFPNAKRIGVTATPISSKKKFPLKDYYEVMYEVATITQLQALNEVLPKAGVVPSNLYHLSNINRADFKKNSEGEFDERSVSKELSKPKQIENTIAAYDSHGKGLKTLCFDSDIDHSKKMVEAFKYHYDSIEIRHVNGSPKDKFGKKSWRRDSLEWLEHTPGSILNNVNILNTGFDEPSVECIIPNRPIGLLSTWIQMLTRGSRPFQYLDGTWKKEYLVLDMGNNAVATGGNLGDCNQDPDWLDWFENPNKPKNGGVGGMKACPDCGATNSAGAKFCRGFKEDWLTDSLIECGYIFPIAEKEIDSITREMIKYFNVNIDVQRNIKYFVNDLGKSHGMVYFETINQIANMAAQTFDNKYLDSVQLDYFLQLAITKIKELGKASGRRTMKENVKGDLFKALQKSGFIVNVEEILEMI